MPKRIDSTVWVAIEAAYLNRISVSYTDLSKEFGVSISSIKNKGTAGNWAEKRERVQADKDSTRSSAARKAIKKHSKKATYELLSNAMHELYAEGMALDGKSKEGCFSALNQLAKTQRELYPPNPDELADMAVSLGITADQFLEALRRRWEQELEVVEPSAKPA